MSWYSLLGLGNSYEQIGHTLAFASIGMAQEGHSFLFMLNLFI